MRPLQIYAASIVSAMRPFTSGVPSMAACKCQMPKKLKTLEAENAKLKKLLAEQMMDVSTLKELLGKNS